MTQLGDEKLTRPNGALSYLYHPASNHSTALRDYRGWKQKGFNFHRAFCVINNGFD